MTSPTPTSPGSTGISTATEPTGIPGAMLPLRTVASRYRPVTGPSPTAATTSSATARRPRAAHCPMERSIIVAARYRALVGAPGPLGAEEAVGERGAEALERCAGRPGERQRQPQMVGA